MDRKSKIMRIAVDVILIVVGIGFLIWGIMDAIDMYKSSQTPDNILFARSYKDVGSDNSYKYISLKEINNIIEKGTGIIFVGSPEDSWSQVLVAPLEQIVESFDIETIYYLEKEENDDLSEIKSSVPNKSVPHIIIVKDGNILTELTKSEIFKEDYDGIPVEYFDEENLNLLKTSLEDIEKIK